ncbi:hypothetical protein SDRG_02216 [Saprolegnia diclina VS20]|uniref:F-box domain-containing protein n=1 Tax=Saprolegnia diclina (strain VS20) TaxID=1156394 RepID=T0QQA3_SAPDV|nr:hypothetical protein SDRG_02216 [Saprolegnia diclina VS20]EQC40314.1 hypothetical protein SDRG_02216 [Saprolegnia diclina VS20]|eukprot:XP_008606013.1 hypothetical protein SDRG_02216 [Saprolegnia diclina VS20]
MTADNRATSAPWLLPPIALQILHYFDDTDDARAFLLAAPNDSLDDALNALRMLFAMGLELPMWPTPRLSSLDAAYHDCPNIVTKALPLFKTIAVDCSQDCSSICQITVLPPTTVVSAVVQYDVTSVCTGLGKWLPNLVNLMVTTPSHVDFAAVVKDSLSSCPRLRSLTINQDDVLTQDTFDAALIAVVAACPQAERIVMNSTKRSPLSDCKTLLAWLALPTARHLELNGTDFQGEPSAELATAMLTSTRLETIELLEAPSLARAILSPSSPPLPRQLRHLAIWDYTRDMNDVSPPLAFDEADMADLAAKIANSHLKSLDLWLEAPCDATSVLCVSAHIPTLTKLAARKATLTSFPPLTQLLHLELSSVTLSDKAVESLAALLRSSPKLVQLHLGNDPLPISQANTILRALPQWLSHRGSACGVHLAIQSDACATAFAAALAQTSNTHKVKITVSARGLSVKAKTRIVAALASTSRMALVFSGFQNLMEDADLEACGRQHHLTIVYLKQHPRDIKHTWFHSPRK